MWHACIALYTIRFLIYLYMHAINIIRNVGEAILVFLEEMYCSTRSNHFYGLIIIWLQVAAGMPLVTR